MSWYYDQINGGTSTGNGGSLTGSVSTGTTITDTRTGNSTSNGSITLRPGDQFTLDGSGAWTYQGTATATSTQGGTATTISGFYATLTTVINGSSTTATYFFSTTNLPSNSGQAVKYSISENPGASDTICFYPGTRIRTPGGEIAVEVLKIGDLVCTSEGKTMPVHWVGRQTVSTLFADPLRVLPIRITAGALAENLPVRDLLVSSDHALFIAGVLIHAGALVNGITIRRESNVPQVFTYFHIELSDHSLILAENVPVETFVDNVDRMAFDNWGEHEALYGADAPIAELEIPRAKSARQVPIAVRQHLAARAAALCGPAAVAA